LHIHIIETIDGKLNYTTELKFEFIPESCRIIFNHPDDGDLHMVKRLTPDQLNELIDTGKTIDSYTTPYGGNVSTLLVIHSDDVSLPELIKTY
jgi:hypothetical protein